MANTRLIQEAFDEKHFRRIEKILGNIHSAYLSAIREATALAGGVNFDPKKPFSFSDFPATKKRVDKMLSELGETVEFQVKKGMKDAWLFSALKNDKVVETVLDLNKFPRGSQAKYFSRNLEALDSFISRKEGGLGLSDKIWNLTGKFKTELEMGIDSSLLRGESAAVMSRNIRGYLKSPDNLFRRVRDDRGMLHLSKRAKELQPGRGVYRSSYKNAMRVTRTEINMSYRAADHERWKQLDFIVGIEIRLTNSPKHVVDICDDLKGKYPKEFKFRGWHPQCMCHAITIMATPAEREAMTDKILSGEPPSDIVSENAVNDVPGNFKKWIDKNNTRLAAPGTTPYFIKDNYPEGIITNGLRPEITMRASAPKTGSGLFIEKPFVINSEMADSIREAKNPSGLIIQPQWEAEFKRLGHSDKAIQEAKALINKHGLDTATQEAADRQIVELLNNYNSDVGAVLRTTIDMEEKAYRTWQLGVEARYQKAKAELLKDYAESPETVLYRNNRNSIEDVLDDLRDEYDPEFRIYRGGSLDKDVLAFTKDKYGANTGKGRIPITTTTTIDEMLSDGHKMLGGVCRMTGAPGEAEITFINKKAITARAAEPIKEVSEILSDEEFNKTFQVLIDDATGFRFEGNRFMFELDYDKGQLNIPAYLTKNEAYCVYNYTTPGIFGKLNRYLNKGEYIEHEQAILAWEKALKHTLAKVRANDPMKTTNLFRGSRVGIEDIKDIQQALKSGKEWRNKGFFSTSMDQSVADNFLPGSTDTRKSVQFFIESKSGADIGGFTSLNEKEILFGSNKAWKIIDITYNKVADHYCVWLEDF